MKFKLITSIVLSFYCHFGYPLLSRQTHSTLNRKVKGTETYMSSTAMIDRWCRDIERISIVYVQYHIHVTQRRFLTIFKWDTMETRMKPNSRYRHRARKLWALIWHLHCYMLLRSRRLFPGFIDFVCVCANDRDSHGCNRILKKNNENDNETTFVDEGQGIEKWCSIFKFVTWKMSTTPSLFPVLKSLNSFTIATFFNWIHHKMDLYVRMPFVKMEIVKSNTCHKFYNLVL